MNKVYLLIGGNLGNITANLAIARDRIAGKVGHIQRASSCYRTAAWGVQEQPDFVNQALEVMTDMQASEVLEAVLQIENEMGRIRVQKMGPRLIDIDILLFNEEIIDTPDLSVPHPFLHERNFVLVPLAEIAPEVVHPVLKKRIAQLLSESKDKLRVDEA